MQGSKVPFDEVRVVVVDDSLDAAESLAELLRAHGCAVHTAGSACLALELIARHRPHCVLFDILMPGMSGDELCAGLRAQYGDDIVLIAVSGHTDSDPRVGRAFALADHYFTKPVDAGRLIELLRPQH